MTSALPLVQLPSVCCSCMKIVQRQDEVTFMNQRGEEKSCERWWNVNPCAGRVGGTCGNRALNRHSVSWGDTTMPCVIALQRVNGIGFQSLF